MQVISLGQDCELGTALDRARIPSSNLFKWSWTSLKSLIHAFENNLDIWTQSGLTLARFKLLNKKRIQVLDWQVVIKFLSQLDIETPIITGLVDSKYEYAYLHGEILSASDLLAIQPETVYQINCNKATYLREKLHNMLATPNSFLFIRKQTHLNIDILEDINQLARVLASLTARGSELTLAIAYLRSDFTKNLLKLEPNKLKIDNVRVVFHSFDQFARMNDIDTINQNYSNWVDLFLSLGLNPYLHPQSLLPGYSGTIGLEKNRINFPDKDLELSVALINKYLGISNSENQRQENALALISSIQKYPHRVSALALRNLLRIADHDQTIATELFKIKTCIDESPNLLKDNHADYANFGVKQSLKRSQTKLNQIQIGLERSQVPSFKKLRIVALLTVRNEECYLATCLEHLYAQGIETCLIDNGSSDRTLEIAEKFRDRGVFRIEHLAFNDCFALENILLFSEKLAQEIDADWFIHYDVDEIHQAPKPYKTLLEGITAADRQGYNVINFNEFVFLPTSDQESFTEKDYVKLMRYYYFFEPQPLRLLRAWKKTPNIDLHTSGGHQIEFSGKKVFPISFILRHYITLSRNHAIAKYGNRVFGQSELERGWHYPRNIFSPNQLNFPAKEQLKKLNDLEDNWDTSEPWHEHKFMLGNVMDTQRENSQVTNAEPNVTIVVTQRERFSHSQRSLENLYEGTNYPFKLIYIDANSPSVIQTYLHEQSQVHGFHLIRVNHFLPPCQARNLALGELEKQAPSKYIVFIDNDVLVTKGWLKALVRCAEETQAAIVTPLILMGEIETQVIHLAGGKIHIEEIDGKRYLERDLRFQHERVMDVASSLVREPCDFGEFHCMLVRMDFFKQVGKFDESLWSVWEEYDFCLSAQQAGNVIYFEPTSVITYIPPPPLESFDLDYFLLRWSTQWNLTSIHHFCQKWNFDQNAPLITAVYKWLNNYRSLAYAAQPLVYIPVQNDIHVICTITSTDDYYLGRVYCWRDSFLQHHPNGKLFVLFLDEVKQSINFSAENLTPIFMHELDIPDLDNMLSQYDRMELCGALKPFLLEYLFKHYKYAKICYFDSDIYFYRCLDDEIWQKLNTYTLILTPHWLQLLDAQVLPKELNGLRQGIFNSGFIGLSQGTEAERFLNWWKTRLANYCYNRPEQGMFCDQGWLNFVPVLGLDYHINLNAGLNVAFWNLHERQFTQQDGVYRVNGMPLQFFHFSGYSPDHPQLITKHSCDQTLDTLPELKPLFADYQNQLEQHIRKLQSLSMANSSFQPTTYVSEVISSDAMLAGVQLQQMQADLERSHSRLAQIKLDLEKFKSQYSL